MEQNEFITLKRAALEAAYAHLNDKQREAVFCVNGPLLILAGAGSGKTTVLINRIAYLLRFGNAYYDTRMPQPFDEQDEAFLRDCVRNGVGTSQLERLAQVVGVATPPPWAVMAITFTNKAADELKSRLQRAVGADSESILASTFHSACVRFLRRDGERIGRAGNFTIYDSDDSQRMIKQIIASLNLDDRKFSPKTVRNAISAAKNDSILPEEYEACAGSDYYKQVIAKVYTAYRRALTDNNAMDFDDLLLETVRLLESSPELLERYRNRFRYILVDEYQDTNMVQYKLIRLLAGENGNLCVVGDDDQSIYKFRGATIENILSFEQNFKSARVVRLEQNYRSTGNILGAANEVIAKNEARKGKTLWTDRGDGEKVEQKQFTDERGEAMFIAKSIQSHVRKGGRYSDCAVLYRINAVSSSIERTLVSYSIPYRVFGGVRFYDHKEIKDMLAYLAVLNNPADDLRLTRIINEPKRGIGDSTVEAVRRIAGECGCGMFEIIAHCDEYAALSGKTAALNKFAAMMQGLADELESGTALSEVYEHLLADSGYLTALQAAGFQEQGRVENVTELLSEIKKYEKDNPDGGLGGFLEDCALMTDFDNYDESADAAVLMTVHGAKGLEFDTVFVAACEENVFPSYMAIMEPGEIEEERRLAYVAFTRAKRKLYITHAQTRMLYGSTGRNRLSRFAADIPEKFKTVTAVEGDNPATGGRTGYGSGYASPRSGFSAPSAPAKPKMPPAPAAAPIDKTVFTPGMSVIHPTFGHGVITNASKMGGDTLLEIAFDNSGTKRIMANFARLKKQ